MNSTYLYIRYSDDKQEQGSSHSRQIERARAYCSQNGLTLIEDDDHVFFDGGKSAFKGEHLAEGGELKRFYDRVEDGTIPRGSVLLVEELDRLSRAGMWSATEKFRELTDNGIVVITLMDGKRWDGSGGISDALTLMIKADLAHQESAKKSDRVAGSWTKRYSEARAGRRIKFPLCSWLTYDEADATKYKFKEPEASVVREIFEMAATGFGMTRIAQELHTRGHKPFRGSKWITASVFSIVKNRTAIGTYTPRDSGEPVENYFPAVVDESLFNAAQGAISERKVAGGARQSKKINVWNGIAKCGLCGGALHCLPKGRGKNEHRYLVCSNKTAGLCKDAKNVRAEDSEEVFKELLVKVASPDFVQEDKGSVERELRELVGQIAWKRERLEDVAAIFDAAPSIRLGTIMGDIEEEVKTLTAEKEALEAKAAQQQVTETSKAWFLERLQLEEPDKRLQANALLKRMKISVRVVSSKTQTTYIAERERVAGDRVGIIQKAIGQPLVPFLSLVSTKDGEGHHSVTILPLSTEQKAKVREQETDGVNLKLVNELLEERLGIKVP
jgi:DNA invertase Pin-like site-specific DNA recombinase